MCLCGITLLDYLLVSMVSDHQSILLNFPVHRDNMCVVFELLANILLAPDTSDMISG